MNAKPDYARLRDIADELRKLRIACERIFVTKGNPISSISLDGKKVLFASAGATC